MAIEMDETPKKQPPLFEMTDEQVDKLRAELARLVGERETEQALKDAANKEFNDTLKRIEKRISETARVIREQEEARG